MLLEQKGSPELSSHLTVRQLVRNLTLKQLPGPAAEDLCIHTSHGGYTSCDGTICPPKALNLCLTLLAQKLDAMNSLLVFFLTFHAENEFGDE